MQEVEAQVFYFCSDSWPAEAAQDIAPVASGEMRSICVR